LGPLWAPLGDALDKPNRSTWQLLAASSTLRHVDSLTLHATADAAAVAFAAGGARPVPRAVCGIPYPVRGTDHRPA
jgi:hypothetical protein